MTDHELESHLLAARPLNNAYSPFTEHVLQEIKRVATSKRLHRSARVSRWKALLHGHFGPRKAFALILILIVLGFIGFSSYAYATGSDPFTLIKRLVVGNEVKVTYQDPVTQQPREFTYGAKRKYSDAAITAYAELSILDILHFRATNAYTVPKNGFEHVSDPFNTEYHFPWIGEIESVGDTTVTVHKRFETGHGKLGVASRDLDERVTLPKSDLYLYAQGEPAEINGDAVGKLVEVFQDPYLRHKIGSPERPVSVNLYSAFILSHPLDAVKEAAHAELNMTEETRDIYEPNSGDYSTICGNNGADVCNLTWDNPDGGQSLFSSTISPGKVGGGPQQSNPDVIAYGEAVLVPTAETRQYIGRGLQGEITKIEPDRVFIKTSSGAIWSFEYLQSRQQAFAKAYKNPLKVGQKLAGSLVISVYDLNRRDLDSRNIYTMSRY